MDRFKENHCSDQAEISGQHYFAHNVYALIEKRSVAGCLTVDQKDDKTDKAVKSQV